MEAAGSVEPDWTSMGWEGDRELTPPWSGNAGCLEVGADRVPRWVLQVASSCFERSGCVRNHVDCGGDDDDDGDGDGDDAVGADGVPLSAAVIGEGVEVAILVCIEDTAVAHAQMMLMS